MNNTKEYLQRRRTALHNEALKEIQAAQAAGKADNPAMRRLADTWAQLQMAGKVSETTSHVAAPSEDGPVMRQAKAWAKELRQARVTEAMRQATGGGVGEATHKLPPHVVYG